MTMLLTLLMMIIKEPLLEEGRPTKESWICKVSLSKKSQRLIYASLDNIIVDYKLFSYLKMTSDQ